MVIGIGMSVCLLFAGSLTLFIRAKTIATLLQLLSAACFMLVVLAHAFEAFSLFPWGGWGQETSFGHYVDFVSAALGLALFPMGYLWHAITLKRA